MKILITGICGFVGSTLARSLLDHSSAVQIVGLDNFSRPGSELNRSELRTRGVQLFHGDIRSPSDLESLPPVDWIIDAAANPSVLAGVDDRSSSRQVVEHNLYGTINILEFAKKHRAGFILLSTSRVYSIAALAKVAMEEGDGAFRPIVDASLPPGLSSHGISETFSTASPLSLYGATKLASECMALEYGETFNLPVWINRCGLLAGAGQFGRADQGIVAYWINSYLRERPLRYIGFGGSGLQTRDALHPRDLTALLLAQMTTAAGDKPRIVNFGGGTANAISLRQLTAWCAARFGEREIAADPAERRFDLPWVVLDTRLAQETWKWSPQTSLESILEESAEHAAANPHWLEISEPV